MARRPRTAEANRLEDVMTVDQVAAYLQLNRLTVYRYVREGKIPAARIGKVYRILRADLDRFIESLRVTAGTPGRATGSPAPEPARPRQKDTRGASVWVRDVKSPGEIFVGSNRAERRAPTESSILTGDPLEVIIRGNLH